MAASRHSLAFFFSFFFFFFFYIFFPPFALASFVSPTKEVTLSPCAGTRERRRGVRDNLEGKKDVWVAQLLCCCIGTWSPPSPKEVSGIIRGNEMRGLSRQEHLVSAALSRPEPITARGEMPSLLLLE